MHVSTALFGEYLTHHWTILCQTIYPSFLIFPPTQSVQAKEILCSLESHRVCRWLFTQVWGKFCICFGLDSSSAKRVFQRRHSLTGNFCLSPVLAESRGFTNTSQTFQGLSDSESGVKSLSETRPEVRVIYFQRL